MCYLSFLVFIFLLDRMMSSSIHFPEKDIIALPFMYMCTVFTRSSASGCLTWLHNLAIINSVSVRLHADLDSFGCTSRNVRVGSFGSQYFHFCSLSSFYSDFLSGYFNLHSPGEHKRVIPSCNLTRFCCFLDASYWGRLLICSQPHTVTVLFKSLLNLDISMG